MTTTEVPRKLVDIFPTKTCGRCDGSGRYSYNQIDGDKCYGCNGSGLAWASKKVAEAVNAFQAAQKAAKQRLVADLTPGVEVLDTLGYRRCGGEKWVTVTAVQPTDKPCGWRVGPDGQRTDTTWYTVVTLDNGTERELSGAQIVRTRSYGVDVTPFVEMAAS